MVKSPRQHVLNPMRELLNENSDIRNGAVVIMLQLNSRGVETVRSPETVQALTEILATVPGRRTRENIILLLGELGSVAEPALPLLEKIASDDPAQRVRSATAAAIDRIRNSAENASDDK